MNIDGPPGYPPHHAVTRMERDNHFTRGPAAATSSFGHFGHHLTGTLGHADPMCGAPGYYGAYPHAAAYGNHNGNPIYGPPVSHHNYGVPGLPTSAPPPHSRAEPSGYSSALVVRRDDNAELDPQVRQWREMLGRLFGTVKGWAKDIGRVYVAGTAEVATRNNPKLWQYILTVATCHKDRGATSGHALFLLESPEHRAQFITRLLLQYIEQEMLRPKLWLGWDDDTDRILDTSVIPVLENPGHPFDQRRTARQRLASVVESILNDPQYGLFRDHRTELHVRAFKDIVQPFFGEAVEHPNANLGLHSIANVAMEVCGKMMTSRLSFSFIWNECGVKFSHDSHVALNKHIHGISVEHKHMRVAVVVTPSVSYRDDTGPSIVPRSVCKAEVLVML
ncbi:hypothetical protein diail_4840 [Diaporthe ilicicola]|nr:hypothetical protein diail_4840 [Diaporthe ilicicola]